MLTRKQVIKRIKDLHKRRQPLNTTAVKRNHPELIEAAFGIKPFWGWRNALKDAEIDYSQINIELTKFVTCNYCGERVRSLQPHISSLHRVTTQRYFNEFNMPSNSEVKCEEELSSISFNSIPKSGIPHWEPIWSPWYALDRIHYLYLCDFKMNSGAIYKYESSLVHKCWKYFESWDEAIRKVGLEPTRLYVRSKAYTKSEVLTEIKQRFKNHLALNSNGMKKALLENRATSLYSSGVKFFGTWRSALEAAEIAPDQVEKILSRSSYPTRNDIIREIRRREKSELGLHRTDLEKPGPNADRGLVNCAYRVFGSWPAALEAAGINSDKYTIRKKFPSPDAVINEILRRKKKGISNISSKILSGPQETRDAALYSSAKNFFGGWKNALKAAGLPEHEVRPFHRFETKKAVIAEIKRRHKEGLSNAYKQLIQGAKEVREPSLYYSGLKLFGGNWRNVLKAAGIPETEMRPVPKSYESEDAVINAVKLRIKKGLPIKHPQITTGAFEQRDSALVKAGRKFFGSWRKTLCAAGVPETQMYRLPQYFESATAVINEIKTRREKGFPNNSQNLVSGPREQRNSSLLHAGRKFFGEWRQALIAAGIPKNELPPKRNRYPSKESIITEIKRRHKKNFSLNGKLVFRGPKEQRDSTLHSSARKHFGSWKKALKAAKVDPQQYTLKNKKYPDKESIVRELKRRARKGMVLTSSQICKGSQEDRDATLYKDAFEFYGSWKKALAAAGIQRSKNIAKYTS